jgi:hypothetical protein
MSEGDLVEPAIAPRSTTLKRPSPQHVDPTPPAMVGTDRASIEQLLAYLGTLHDQHGQRCTDAALDSIAALLEQAEQRTPKPKGPRRATVIEYRGRVCRVCGRQAPPQSALRHDDLRVCRDAGCRKEAQRRDNLAKQHRRNDRKRAAAQGEVGSAVG